MTTTPTLKRELLIWTTWLLAIVTFVIVGMQQRSVLPESCILLPLEFAHSINSAHIMLHPARDTVPALTQRVAQNTYWDFGFIIAYTVLIVVSCFIFWERVSIRPMSRVLMAVAVMPGIFDIVENIYILRFCADKDVLCFGLYMLVVRLKWAIAVPMALLCMAVIFYFLLILIDLAVSFIDGLLHRTKYKGRSSTSGTLLDMKR